MLRRFLRSGTDIRRGENFVLQVICRFLFYGTQPKHAEKDLLNMPRQYCHASPALLFRHGTRHNVQEILLCSKGGSKVPNPTSNQRNVPTNVPHL